MKFLFQGGDYIIPVGWDKMLSRFGGTLIVLQTFLKLYPLVTREKFHSGKTGSLFCTAGILLCRDEIFPCNRSNPPKGDENVI